MAPANIKVAIKASVYFKYENVLREHTSDFQTKVLHVSPSFDFSIKINN
jgi:hypothetical protein